MNGINPRRRVAAPVALSIFALVAAGLLSLGTTSGTAAQSQYAPKSTAPPTIAGTASQGGTLTANVGTWTGDQPLVFEFLWLRCNSGGQNCVQIPNATQQTYVVAKEDVDQTLRVQVTGRNSQGSASATSNQSAKVAGPAGPSGAITLPGGLISVPVTSIPADQNLIVDSVQFSPSPVRSRSTPITVTIRIKDTRGYVVRDAFVFLRSTPVVTTTPNDAKTGQDGAIRYTVQPESDFPVRNGYSVQFFVKAYRQGDNPLGGITGYRLVQVPTAR